MQVIILVKEAIYIEFLLLKEAITLWECGYFLFDSFISPNYDSSKYFFFLPLFSLNLGSKII